MNPRSTVRRRTAPTPEAAAPAPAEAPPQPPPTAAPADPPRRLSMGDLEAIAAMDVDELGKMLLDTSSHRRLAVGERVAGVVTRIDDDEVYVDVGARSEATVDRSELGPVAPGSPISAWVVSNDEFGVRLSVRLGGDAAAAFLEEAHASGIPVEGKVVSRNPGGYEVRVGGVRAFCPASMMDRVRPADPDAFVQQTLTFLVAEVGEKIVLSRRMWLEAQALDQSRSTWETLIEGSKATATVLSVRPFGAFVQIGGVDALLPTRDFPWNGAVRPGDTIEVTIVRVDRDARKVQVTAREASDAPWNGPLAPGTTVSGPVVRVEPYGVLVDLGHGARGLLHRTQIRGALPAVGTVLDVRIASVDEERERIELERADASDVAAGPSTGARRPEPGGFGTLEGLLKGWTAPTPPRRR